MAAKKAASGPLRTLMEAHEELVRSRPCRRAPPHVWLSYYQHSATVYERIAETDPGHEAEAQYWAQRERAHARGIQAQIRLQIPSE